MVCVFWPKLQLCNYTNNFEIEETLPTSLRIKHVCDFVHASKLRFSVRANSQL
jgi:hypothetical protein